MLVSPYLSHAELLKIFSQVNLDGLDESEIQESINQAQGDMESRLNKRFHIPLLAKGKLPLENAPSHTVSKIKVTLKSAIRVFLSEEYLRNSDLNGLSEYGDTQNRVLYGHIKDLLDFQNDFGLELKPYAQDSVEPVQHVGIAKANNDMYQD